MALGYLITDGISGGGTGELKNKVFTGTYSQDFTLQCDFEPRILCLHVGSAYSTAYDQAMIYTYDLKANTDIDVTVNNYVLQYRTITKSGNSVRLQMSIPNFNGKEYHAILFG